MEKTKNRESNVELLRIIASVGVIILHYNNHDMGGDSNTHCPEVAIRFYFIF